ncbi:MAG: hypothetical protein ACRC1T_03915 [Clostridium chrysemydis]|uniref:hypothetical protein n=1 Tax=Clostridium chrysemydis TaxID=2665504 RepID=UPI003F2D54F8
MVKLLKRTAFIVVLISLVINIYVYFRELEIELFNYIFWISILIYFILTIFYDFYLKKHS